jgi:hypothetical protein
MDSRVTFSGKTRRPDCPVGPMSTTNAARLLQRAQRLEIPDKPISTSAAQSVDAACHKFLQKRGMIYKLTSSYSGKRVKKEARDNRTKEAAERCAESGTFPARSDSDGQAVSMTIR